MQGEDLLQALYVVAQPIVDLRTGHTQGYEILIRGPAGTPAAVPQTLFPWAAANGLAAKVESRCQELAVQWSQTHLASDQWLWINVNGEFLGPGILQRLKGWPMDKTVLEIGENWTWSTHPDQIELLQQWQTRELRIAVDDFGSGLATARVVLSVRPDIVKVDRQLVAEIDRDAANSNSQATKRRDGAGHCGRARPHSIPRCPAATRRARDGQPGRTGPARAGYGVAGRRFSIFSNPEARGFVGENASTLRHGGPTGGTQPSGGSGLGGRRLAEH